MYIFYWIATESDFSSNLIGEYGTISLNWQTVSFNNSYTNPIVIVSDPSFNGCDPGNIRIKNVELALLKQDSRNKL